MPWITMDESRVRSRLSAPELAALKSVALQAGQTSPLPDVIASVTQAVRGYVEAWAANRLGAGATIPSRLESAASALIRFELATRLPVASLLTDDRRKEYDAALQLLRDVAAGRFAVDVPDTISTEAAHSSAPAFIRYPRAFGVADQDGL